MHKNIFFSYAFSSDGSSRQIERSNTEEISKKLKDKDLAWIHLDGNSKQSKKWLENEVSYLDHIIIDAIFANETRPRIIEFEKGLLIILRGVNLENKSNSEEMSSIRIWVDDVRIISVQKQNFSAAFNFAEKINQGKKIKNSAEFLYNLIYENLLLITPLISDLNDKIDDVEDQISKTKNTNSLQESIASIRKKVAIFKRYLLPQKDVLSHLKSHDVLWINNWAKRHFQENHEQITHLIEELDEARDRSQIVHEEISNTIADRLNKSMFKISLIASIFMPLSFIAGLFGMNVGGIPGSENDIGFYTVIIIMAIMISPALLIMKARKWF